MVSVFDVSEKDFTRKCNAKTGKANAKNLNALYSKEHSICYLLIHFLTLIHFCDKVFASRITYERKTNAVDISKLDKMHL